MEPRLNDFKANPEAMKAMTGIEQHIVRSGLEKPLMELVRLRTSQIHSCADCLDGHTADARKGGEDERRLATLGVWRETPFFSEREGAALEWAEALTAVADAHAPDEVWVRVTPQFSSRLSQTFPRAAARGRSWKSHSGHERAFVNCSFSPSIPKGALIYPSSVRQGAGSLANRGRPCTS